jgi:hypothetical protein
VRFRNSLTRARVPRPSAEVVSDSPRKNNIAGRRARRGREDARGQRAEVHWVIRPHRAEIGPHDLGLHASRRHPAAARWARRCPFRAGLRPDPAPFPVTIGGRQTAMRNTRLGAAPWRSASNPRVVAACTPGRAGYRTGRADARAAPCAGAAASRRRSPTTRSSARAGTRISPRRRRTSRAFRHQRHCHCSRVGDVSGGGTGATAGRVIGPPAPSVSILSRAGRHCRCSREASPRGRASSSAVRLARRGRNERSDFEPQLPP